MANYIDPVSGAQYPLDVPRWCSEAGRPLWIEPGDGISRDDIDTGVRSLWRYRAALPVDCGNPISLGEGCTPLIGMEWDGMQALVKADFLNPTGSFKDRGTSVLYSYLRSRGITDVCEDSSGNGGSSAAGYAAAGGMSATIFVPAQTSVEKVFQVRAYGARVELVPGPRIEAQNEAIRRADDGYYASHNWNALFLQGTKTIAYEIWEDLGYRAPDNVIVPVGAGSSLLGCWLGFTELLRAGSIHTMPRLFAAQPLNCSPVDVAAAGEGRRPVRPTIAEGTAIEQPVRMAHILRAMSGSAAVAEDGIVTALSKLAERGLFVEPTSAVAAAALSSLLGDGVIRPDEQTVVLLTGSGMKSAARIAKLLGQP